MSKETVLLTPYLECQKCKLVSGDNWSQCKNKCPIENSFYFDEETFREYGPLLPAKENSYGLSYDFFDDGRYDKQIEEFYKEDIPY